MILLVSGLLLKNKKGKKIVVRFKKVSGTKGYQVQYALTKKFKKSKTIVGKKTSVTIRKMKKGKTYYFRIRAYTLNAGRKVYGKWSSIKKIKVKK